MQYDLYLMTKTTQMRSE